MRSMVSYSKAAMERAMKVQVVILRAMAKRITWWQAAEIIGISERHMRRWRERYEEFGYDGLFDRRRGEAISPASPHGPGGTDTGTLQLPSRLWHANCREQAWLLKNSVLRPILCGLREYYLFFSLL